jgi:hypothetical protein
LGNVEGHQNQSRRRSYAFYHSGAHCDVTVLPVQKKPTPFLYKVHGVIVTGVPQRRGKAPECLKEDFMISPEKEFQKGRISVKHPS